MNAIEKLHTFAENPVENVLIFVSDALRWDYLPDTVRTRGLAVKTIAASTFTASSFPSMVSGIYPYNHTVYNFLDELPSYIPTLLDIPGYDTSLWCENTWAAWECAGGSQIHEILGCNPPKSLDELESPFIYIEDEKGGHCPYGWTENGPYKENECQQFFRDYSTKPLQAMRYKYTQGIARSVKEFEARLKILKEKGTLDETLIIFTSDHGELLGEYGFLVGHGNFMTPELVYVPTVFIHPDLPCITESENIMRHVDLFPTLVDALGMESQKYTVEGQSLVTTDALPVYGKSYYQLTVGSLCYVERGVWDAHGGYVLRDGSTLLRILREAQCLVRSASIEGIYLRGKLKTECAQTIRDYPQRLKTEISHCLTFGSPQFTLEHAKERAQDVPLRVGEKELLTRKIAHLKRNGAL